MCERDGHLLKTIDIAGSSTLLLDLAFHPTTGNDIVVKIPVNDRVRESARRTFPDIESQGS